MGQTNNKLARLLVLILFSTAMVVSGCGNRGGEDAAVSGKNTTQGSTGSGETGKLTRAEYIGLLGEGFGLDDYESGQAIFQDVNASNPYYAQIQAAAEWQIIEKEGNFEPDRDASLEFALESAVRAVGIESIEASGAQIDVQNLPDFYVNNIAKIDVSNREMSVDSQIARQIIEYARNYDNQLVIPRQETIEFADGVKQAGMDIRLNADGQTGVLSEASGYQVGDIVYIEGTDHSLPRAIKITGIKGETFTFEDASVRETFSNISIHGTFDGKIVEFTAASDASAVGLADSIYEEMKSYNSNMAARDSYQAIQLAKSIKTDKDSDHLIVTASFDVKASNKYENKYKQNYTNAGDNVEFDNKIDVKASTDGKLIVGIKNIKVSIDYDHTFLNPLNPTLVGAKLTFDTQVYAELNGNVAVTIPLGEMYVQIGNFLNPINLHVLLTAHINADGTVKIDYTTENVAKIEWQKGCGLSKKFTSDAEADFHADATLTAQASLLVDLRLGYKKASYSITNAQITGGAVAHATLDADIMGEQPTCADVQIYIPMEWGVNQESCLVTDIKNSLKAKGVIWDSANSPVQVHLHFEDWVRTANDECTRKEVVEQELMTPEGEPLIEIDPFTFEPLEFDFIELDSYVMFLGKGQSMSIGFTNIPEGYSQADLVYEVEDNSVCSVSGGKVTAGNAGSTIVRIRTNDGMFSVSLAVTVNEDYSIDGFQAL